MGTTFRPSAKSLATGARLGFLWVPLDRVLTHPIRITARQKPRLASADSCTLVHQPRSWARFPSSPVFPSFFRTPFPSCTPFPLHNSQWSGRKKWDRANGWAVWAMPYSRTSALLCQDSCFFSHGPAPRLLLPATTSFNHECDSAIKWSGWDSLNVERSHRHPKPRERGLVDPGCLWRWQQLSLHKKSGIPLSPLVAAG